MAQAAGPKPGSWGSLNSRHFIKNYDKSPVHSPKNSPPQSASVSRKNSTTSINSFQSEPAWHTGRHQSEPIIPSFKPRQDSVASQASAQSTASHKKGGFMGGIFSKEAKEERARKKQAKQDEYKKIVITSRHAAAAKTSMMMDPNYKTYQEKHRKDSGVNLGTNGGFNEHHSSHSTAAMQEARHPHSGPPAVHGSLDMPLLTRIESHDEVDDEIDPYESRRREWNEASEHNTGSLTMHDIPETHAASVTDATPRSRQNSDRPSPWSSPIHSRESSPSRSSMGRPSVSHSTKRNSHHGPYHKDANGRWTKKPTSVSGTSPPGMTPIPQGQQQDEFHGSASQQQREVVPVQQPVPDSTTTTATAKPAHTNEAESTNPYSMTTDITTDADLLAAGLASRLQTTA